MGCRSCNMANTEKARDGSEASAFVVVQPWGTVTFASSEPEFADRCVQGQPVRAQL